MGWSSRRLPSYTRLVFGTLITNSDGKKVPVRYIGEQHVKEDCGGVSQQSPIG